MLFWATQAESLNILRGSERTARKMKDAGLKFNLRGRPPRNSGRSIWRDPEENCRLLAGTQKSRKAMPHTRTLLHFAVCVEGGQKESPTNLITATRQNSPRSWLQEATRVAHQNPSPGGVESSPLYNPACTLRFCSHSVSVAHYLVCSCVWFKSTGRSALPQK